MKILLNSSSIVLRSHEAQVDQEELTEMQYNLDLLFHLFPSPYSLRLDTFMPLPWFRQDKDPRAESIGLCYPR